MENFQDKAKFIWQVADELLRDSFKQHEYGDVILPFVVLRRLDCALEDSKDSVVKTFKKFKGRNKSDLSPMLLKATKTKKNPGGLKFYNTSHYDLRRLAQDAKNVERNFWNYVNGYSPNIQDIINNFELKKVVEKLVKNDCLFQLINKFTEVDLHPDKVSNHQMGYVFEEMLRRFTEMSTESAGEHYTPREIVRLMVNLLFAEHTAGLKGKGKTCSVYDPACGTGGMLTLAKEHIQDHTDPHVEVVMYGQEINEQAYAIAKSDVLILGEEADNIRYGSCISEDKFHGKRFDYLLSNPPFGVSWKKEQSFIENEFDNPMGRFSAGLPRISDGALLFLQHMISKMDPKGSRIAIISNGSPLFSGDAGSGESNIRKWIIENDWLEAIVALPTDLFYNTGIATYIWIVTNKKPSRRKGKIQLIDAMDFYKKMQRCLGSKRNYITDEQIQEITRTYRSFSENETCKIFDNADFGYTKIIIERPEIKNGKVVKDRRGKPKPDSKLWESERIPLKQDIDEFFKQEVFPHVPDAWIDRDKDRIGYEINMTKIFYQYTPLRSLKEIKADILALEKETEGLLKKFLD